MKEDFQKNGYCVVRNAISKELRDFVTQYALFDEMQNFLAEKDSIAARMSESGPQVPNAHSKYADPAMETMLLHIQKILEDNTGLTLFPTYSYYRIYRTGDDLKPHTDRPSCEISCTMCFNYNYDSSNYSWPIYMEGNKIDLNPGDLVVYRGYDLEHWRAPFDVDENAWQVQGFFHYVDVNGPFAEFKWDKRSSIGAFDGERNPKIAEKPYITYL